MINISPFELENTRNILAVKKRNVEFKRTYSPKFQEIDDLNSGTLWDRLNSSGIVDRYGNPMAFDRLTTIHRWIKEEGQINKNSKLLDIGFGQAYLEYLIGDNKKTRNLILYGIDISPKSVVRAKKRFPYWFFQLGNILKLGFKSDFFDCVTVLEVMEHIQPHFTFVALNEVHRVLKKGGTAIFSVPLNEGLEEMILRGYNPNAHVRLYTPEIIKMELKISGFTIEKVKLLYAFHRHYHLKTLITKLFAMLAKPNNVIVFAKKI